jgi:hypothetical protein
MLVNEIASKSRTLQEKNVGIDFWRDTLYESFFLMSSPKAKGARGERLAAEIMETLGHDILRKKNGKPARLDGDADHDIVVGGYRTEVKLSLTWDGQPDRFTWQQIRSLQDYDRIILIGVNPDEVKMWWATKKDLEQNIFGKSCYRQHGGKNGKQELYWIKNEIPSWFRPIGEWK